MGDFSSVRFLSVMWRLNLSALFLLLTLDNSYVLYYIVPLHTLYFIMVYVVMFARRSTNARMWTTLAITFVVSVLAPCPAAYRPCVWLYVFAHHVCR